VLVLGDADRDRLPGLDLYFFTYHAVPKGDLCECLQWL
jgi:hypothetical protein